MRFCNKNLLDFFIIGEITMIKLRALTLAVATAITGTAQAGNIQFTNAAVPTSDLDKRSVLTSSFAIVDGEKVDVNYNTIMRSGDVPGRSYAPFGQLFDIEGEPVIAEDGTERVSNDNDFSSLIVGREKQNGKDKDLYMVSHFESRPAAMYLTKLDQDKNSGELTAIETRPLDFSHVNGGWVHCAGSVTPWGNHLGSEEYPPDGKQWRDGNVSGYNSQMVRYFPAARGALDAELPALALEHINPYDYGYNVEVEVNTFDDATVTKHYSMGRVAIELAYVMPNEKTAYISDDGSRVGLFRYEADVAGDLSAGTLYVAKWNQTSPLYGVDERVSDELRDGGAADISWIELGHATDDEIRDLIDSGVTFADIFDEDVAGCTVISNRNASSECLKVKPGMEKAAAFLETSRYAGILGGTVEFEKMEGITLNPETNTMYLAMSRVRNEMTDGAGDVSVPYNYCGTVYGLDLDQDYVAYNMYGVVNGIPRTYSRGALADNPHDAPYEQNSCDLNGISEPDNVTFIPGYNTLIIGEDTGSSRHQNDIIWAYNLDSEELSRVQTTPYGSETTSPYVYPDINGFGYMMSVIQHPFGESDQDALQVPEEARGYTGYVGPFPALIK
jgi:secreted PhoX family phosphatase